MDEQIAALNKRINRLAIATMLACVGISVEALSHIAQSLHLFGN